MLAQLSAQKDRYFCNNGVEEFRKKKARRPPPVAQQSTEASQNATQTQEGVSNGPVNLSGPIDEPLGQATSSDNNTVDLRYPSDLGSSSEIHTSALSAGTQNAFYAGSEQNFINEPAPKPYQGSELYRNYEREEKDENLHPTSVNKIQEKPANTKDESAPFNIFHGTDYRNGSLYQSSLHSTSETLSRKDEGRLNKDFGTSHSSVTSLSDGKHRDAVQHDAGFPSTSAAGNASSFLYEESFGRKEQSNGPKIFGLGQIKPGSTVNQETSTASAQWKSSESRPSASLFDFRSSFDDSSQTPEIYQPSIRKNRSSFLDSIVPRVSTMSQVPFTQSEKTESYMSSKVHSEDMLAPSSSGKTFTNDVALGSFDNLTSPNLPDIYDNRTNSVSASTGGEMRNHAFRDSIMERNLEPPTAKKDENFAALEQYIEDLTQEKFTLMRDLEAARTLSESLAAENSSLTDSYNQQRATVNQLKSDMESLQEEINSQLRELESFKIEYGNAQLECNAADERAKILASEVIGLEEKSLKLRSSELKLERQLENSNAEITSYKKKVSSLQKERQDLQFTIDALQEEKKLLQNKLRKASGSGKSIEAIKPPSSVKNVSTSTEDLGFEDSELVRDVVDTSIQNTSDYEMQHGFFPATSQFPENQEVLHPAIIPPDQLRMIGNINSLISELSLEKEELIRALSSESSERSKLKELNKELSRKLEVQTQRLELLTAQNMANENVMSRHPDSRPLQDSIQYTDEGDEVVERVLGWIMKLFPGGPSKRRPKRVL
ncbi:hypothetical protein ACHQM5_018689 [Ranunculus cassubicifolius]